MRVKRRVMKVDLTALMRDLVQKYPALYGNDLFDKLHKETWQRRNAWAICHALDGDYNQWLDDEGIVIKSRDDMFEEGGHYQRWFAQRVQEARV